MFFYFSQVKAKSKRFVFAALVLVLLAAFLSGCKTEPEDDTNYEGELPAGLIGKWVFDKDNWYEIQESGGSYKLIYTAIFDDPEWGYFDYSFEGDIEFISNYSSNSGIIIVKYTYGEYDDTKPYTGIYYREITSSTVKLANVWDLKKKDSADTTTLEEAIDKFTRSKTGKYVGYWGTYLLDE